MSYFALLTFLQRLCVWLFWPGAVIVLWGELTPGNGSLETHLWDKMLHFTAYFGLSLMATLALRGNRRAFLTVLALILAGGVLEIVQSFVGRDAEVLDEVANTIGALTGGALGWLILLPRRALVDLRPPA